MSETPVDYDPVELVQLRKQAESLRALKRLQEENGINFYRPHAKQHRFHSAAHVTGRYCRTGNRGGKTKCGAAEDIAFCLGYRPWYQYEFEIRNGNGEVVEVHPGGENHELVTKGIPQRPIKLLMIATDWDKAKEIFTNNEGSYENFGEYFQLLPKGSWTVHKGKSGHVERIDIIRPERFGGGISSITIDTVASYKLNRMSAESSKWDAIHLDEPCPEGLFQAHARGLVDRRGKFWINCTPLTEMWINDEFCPNVRKLVDMAPEGYEFTKGKNNNVTRFMITWSIYDNPHNSKASIEDFEALFNRDSSNLECRLHGTPRHMAGLVYKEFVYDMHVLCDVPKGWEAFDKPPKDYTIRVWWDVHISKHQAILYFATAPNGTIYVYDEQFYTKYIGENALLLIEKTKDYFVAGMEIDQTAFVNDPVDDTNISDVLMEYGLFFQPATKDRTVGTLKVAEKLKERGYNKLPTIFFSPNLRQTLFEFSHYVFNLDTGKPVDKDDHMMENLYRAVLSGLDYVTPVTAEEYAARPTGRIYSGEVYSR